MNPLALWARRHDITPAAWAELHQILAVNDTPSEQTSFKSEAAVQSALQLEAPKHGAALWRNNSGACIDDKGRLVRYGLANTSKKLNDVFKSSDLIGIGPDGKFLAVEVKTPGWKLTPGDKRGQAQARFLTKVNQLGGRGLFAQSVGDVFK